MTDSNILPLENYGEILVALIKGQERSATEMRIQNQRLFGGEGQDGALKFIQKQHEELAKSIKEGFEVVNNTIKEGAKEQDDRITAVERKQYWLSGAGTVFGGLLGSLGTFFGFRHGG